mmetsp:Transcript_7923/g.16502  ORF Transcript_7923/g.16502 Transcript_7923/m.16502 type:complete len:165 (-) Transcript_7923:764-1258(-)
MCRSFSTSHQVPCTPRRRQSLSMDEAPALLPRRSNGLTHKRRLTTPGVEEDALCFLSYEPQQEPAPKKQRRTIAFPPQDQDDDELDGFFLEFPTTTRSSRIMPPPAIISSLKAPPAMREIAVPNVNLSMKVSLSTLEALGWKDNDDIMSHDTTKHQELALLPLL